MSWIQNLNTTYEKCNSMLSVVPDDNQVPLLPICHTTQKAQIEITLDEKGGFKSATVIPKESSRTIIPCTEKSAGRTSGEAAHPLCDKFQYITAEYVAYGGEKVSYHTSYLSLLEDWVMKGAPRKAQLVLAYVRRESVITDLVRHHILWVDEGEKRLLFQRPNEKDKNSPIDIFDLLPGGIDPKTHKYKAWQADAFIRWSVEIPGDVHPDVWADDEMIQSWIRYYTSTKEVKSVCYVTGEERLSADQHPAKIRNDADKAKLIASGKSRDKTGKVTIDDGCGFTFLGRFTYPDQVATVGFDVTQKAHFALRWLISRQGYRKGDLAIVAWATSGQPVLQPTDDPIDILFGNAASEKDLNAYTAQDMGIALKNRIAGYGKALGETENIAVMAVDSATPGRLSITYYRDLKGSDFLRRIDDWQESCAWLHRYREITNADNGKKAYVPFYGAPAPADIAEAAYGLRADDKLRKATISRLLPCIVDGQPIPRDLVESAVRRASSRAGLSEWEWQKTLSIACALFKKFKQRKEKYTMPLDETRTSRDYLYGRLLAIADILEERALYKGEQKRATNAARYMQQFSQSPYRTWKQIHDSLSPYIVKLQGAHFYKNLIAQVESMFDVDEYMSSKPLTGEYLLGYYSQRQRLLEKRDQAEQAENMDENRETQ